jgi:hypothetical protein
MHEKIPPRETEGPQGGISGAVNAIVCASRTVNEADFVLWQGGKHSNTARYCEHFQRRQSAKAASSQTPACLCACGAGEARLV